MAGAGAEAEAEAEALEILLGNDGKLSGAVGYDGGGGGGGTPDAVETGEGAREGRTASSPIWQAAKPAIMRLAAHYLAHETVRGRVADPVGNFHVRKEKKKKGSHRVEQVDRVVSPAESRHVDLSRAAVLGRQVPERYGAASGCAARQLRVRGAGELLGSVEAVLALLSVRSVS